MTPPARTSLQRPSNSLRGMKKTTPLEVLAANLALLMADPRFAHVSTGNKLAAVSGVSQKTINNIQRKRFDPKISTVATLARTFRLEPYQMLLPLVDKSFVTVCTAYTMKSDRDRDLLVAAAETILRRNAQDLPASSDRKAG
jgi:DNA-binding XRE family transcriptional regulator